MNGGILNIEIICKDNIGNNQSFSISVDTTPVENQTWTHTLTYVVGVSVLFLSFFGIAYYKTLPRLEPVYMDAREKKCKKCNRKIKEQEKCYRDADSGKEFYHMDCAGKLIHKRKLPVVEKKVNGLFFCNHCGGEIHPGDEVYFDIVDSNYYHKSCLDNSEIDVLSEFEVIEKTAKRRGQCNSCERTIKPGDSIYVLKDHPEIWYHRDEDCLPEGVSIKER